MEILSRETGRGVRSDYDPSFNFCQSWKGQDVAKYWRELNDVAFERRASLESRLKFFWAVESRVFKNKVACFLRVNSS